MEYDDAVRSRRSIKTYDENATVSDETLRRLFELVALTPSSFNLQHWRFVVVRDAARRAALCKASFGQKHVAAAPAVVVVCGKLAAHEDAARANGHAPQAVLDDLVPIIEKSYAGKERFQRDEAIRSCSLAAMNLMLAARNMGLDTCPMIGYLPDAVVAEVGIPEGFIPVMMVTLGKKGDGDVLPTSRFAVSETVKLEAFDGPGL